MPNINNIIKESMGKRLQLIKELDSTFKLYANMYEDVQNKFREEVRNNNGSMTGLEDFYTLYMKLKKDLTSIKNAMVCVRRTSDLSEFNVSEEELELEKIFSDNK
jgi:esterase/lipase